MGRVLGTAWLLLLAGCASPLMDKVQLTTAERPTVLEKNPVWVPLGPPAYGLVFERVLDVVSVHFPIAYANRYDGTVVTCPRIAAGVGQVWRHGSPDWCERMLATLQTIRHRAEVYIQAADDGGFFVEVRVFRELEDLPRPTLATSGAAVFRTDNVLDRSFDVIDATTRDLNWIPLGRDEAFEQLILREISQIK